MWVRLRGLRDNRESGERERGFDEGRGTGGKGEGVKARERVLGSEEKRKIGESAKAYIGEA